MVDREDELFREFETLFRIKAEWSSRIISECGLSDMTVRQVAYLRAIDEQGEMTFSRLAEITANSKPTITGMIDRFVQMECVYREPCPGDKRCMYIHLTEKGKTVAQAEQAALRRTIEQIADSLDENELDLLIGILRKIG